MFVYTPELQFGMVLAVPLLLQLLGLAFAVQGDAYIDRRDRRTLQVIVFLVFSLVAQNIIEFISTQQVYLYKIRTVYAIYGYIAKPIVIILFLQIVTHNYRNRIAWLLVEINAAVYLSAFFSRITFYIREDNTFQRGPLSFTCYIISAVLMAVLVFQTFRLFPRVKKRDALIPLGSTLAIIGGTALDFFGFDIYPISFLTITMVSSTVFFYIWLHLQFVREHEQALMAEQRIQIMMSQIQPHFLYNTLSTVQALCRLDPERAFDTLGKFGVYLRQNIDSLSQTEKIPFKKELDHTRIYAEIEMIRFPYIHVEYDTPDIDFKVPSLTIQPLVENAIRHGVRIRKDGLVSVTTRREAKEHVIVIRDNGKGFNVEEARQSDENHIGLRNVKERVEKMCGGTLHVDSRIGEGTCITIRIPD